MFEDNNLISSGLTGRDTYVAIMGSGKRIPEAFRDALTEKYEINGSKVDIVEFELDCLMEYEDEFDELDKRLLLADYTYYHNVEKIWNEEFRNSE